MDWHPENLIRDKRYIFHYVDENKIIAEEGVFKELELVDKALCIRYCTRTWKGNRPWVLDVSSVVNVTEVKVP